MPGRRDALAGVVSPGRAARVAGEAARLGAFCRRLGLDESADSVVLYLTSILLDGASGRDVRTLLQLLDLDRRMRGTTPWLQDPDVRTFLTGLHADHPLGDRHGCYDPLYVDLVYALVDAARTPTADNRCAHAAQLIHQSTGLSASLLARLTWDQVRIGQTKVDLTVTTRTGRGPLSTTTHSLATQPGSPTCPVAAMRAVSSVSDGRLVFGTRGTLADQSRVHQYLHAADPLAPAPARVRDAAILLLGYSAGLGTGEAQNLLQGDIVNRPGESGDFLV